MIIRKAKEQDFTAIYNLVKEAFKTADVSDGKEQDFVLELRARDTYVEELEFLAEDKNKIIGHIMFSRQKVDLEKGHLNAVLVAPLCVELSYRNKNIGTKLMQYGFKEAEKLGYNTAFLVGNIKYYQRFGFKKSVDYHIENISGIPDEYVLAAEITSGSLNEITGKIDIH